MNHTISAAAAVCGLALAIHATDASSAVTRETIERSGGVRSFGYTITPTTPQVQYTPDLFVGPYFNYTLTNTGTESDTYHMTISNLTEPSWFGQVCIEAVCFPDSVDVTLGPGASKTVGVNIVPFSDGSCTGDFNLHSVGDPQLTSFFQVTLWAGQGLGAPELLAASRLGLAQNAPNPVRSSTSIGFSLPKPSTVSLAVYDVAGRLVRELASGTWGAGVHSVSWNGADASGAPAAGGVYLYRLSTPDGELTKTLTLVK
jgi:hypothetical protein